MARRRWRPPGPAATLPAPEGQAIVLDYPVRPIPRWGYGKPPHRRIYDRLNAGRDDYRELLRRFLTFTDEFVKIPVGPDPSPTEPNWANGWISGLDAAALYAFLAFENPARYIEVGSGNSTRFARRAIRDHGLRTHVTSIDPHPRAETDQNCDRIVRLPMEDVHPSLFAELAAGDILFVDGSHRCLQNSDVAVLFMEVLPDLAPGVLVHVHDIQLPWDYPTDWAQRWYSELYLLGTWLLADGGRTEIVLPNFFVSSDPELCHTLDDLWTRPELAGAEPWGVSFWFRSP